jgi:hypothetical protein
MFKTSTSIQQPRIFEPTLWATPFTPTPASSATASDRSVFGSEGGSDAMVEGFLVRAEVLIEDTQGNNDKTGENE